MSRIDINYVGQLFKLNGKPKLLEELKGEFNLQNQLKFIYNQITHSLTKSWKDALISLRCTQKLFKIWFSRAIIQ